MHPNDFGYNIYEEYLEKTVENVEIRTEMPKEAMTDRLYSEADLVFDMGQACAVFCKGAQLYT